MPPDRGLIVERAVYIPDLERLPPPGERYDRVYLGNEFCPWRLPDERELGEARAAASRRGMAFSLVTPFLDEPGLARVLALVRALPEEPSTEVVANDLGLIEALRASGWKGSLVAGRLLTRQRRGPGFQSFGNAPSEAAAALRASALDSPGFVELLGERYAVHRFELDDLVQDVAVPPLPAGVRLSLYRPWLLVTATRNCPWVFDGRTWGRESCCPRPCRGHALRLIPEREEPWCQAPDRSGEDRRGPVAAHPRRCPLDAAPRRGSPAPRHPDAVPAYQEGLVQAEGWRGGEVLHRADRREHGGGPQRQDPAACTGFDPHPGRELVLGGCAQFLEHRNEAAPPADVDRIVWQPRVPA